MRVRDLAHHGEPRRLHLLCADADAFADGVLAGPVVLRKFVVDDQHELGARVVSLGEETAVQEANAHGGEEIADDLRNRREVHVRARRRNVSIDDECLVVVHALRRQHAGQAYGLHSGKLAELQQQFAIEGVDLRLLGVLLLGQRIGGRRHVLRREAEIHGAHLFEAAQQQA